MTLFDVEELVLYWRDYPPLHMMLAAHLGFGRRRQTGAGAAAERAAVRSPPAASVGQLAAELGAGFARGDVHAGLDPVVLDFGELRRRSAASQA